MSVAALGAVPLGLLALVAGAVLVVVLVLVWCGAGGCTTDAGACWR